MQVTLQLSTLLYLISFSLVIFLLLYVLIKRNSRVCTRVYLGIFLLGIACTLYDYFIFQNGIIEQVFPCVLFGFVFQLAYGPALYLLTKYLVYPSRKFETKELWHFILATCHVIYGFIFFYFRSNTHKMAMLQRISVANEQPASFFVFNLFSAAQIVVYAILSIRLVQAYKQSNNFKNPIQKKNLVLFLISMLGILSFIVFGNLNLRAYFYAVFAIDLGPFLLQSLSVYLLVVAYFILLTPQIINQPIEKYVSSPLKENDRSKLIRKLELLISEEKPQFQPRLKLIDLATAIDSTPKQLSQLINEVYQTNFQTYINKLRIEEAKRLLIDSQKGNLSITGIGYEVGFHSKSSFYAAFKKVTGTTPAQYEKSYQKSV